MTRNNSALHGPLKFKLHCAKLGFIYSKIAFLTLLKFQVKYGVPFTLLHLWAKLKECSKWKEVELPNFEAHRQKKNKRYKSSGSSSFNTSQSTKGSLNMNMQCGDDKENDVQEVQRPMGRDTTKNKWAASSASTTSGNDETLARLMVIKYANLNNPYNVKKTQNWEALEIRKNVSKLKEQELRMREYEQRQKDKLFYMHHTDHLTGIYLDLTLNVSLNFIKSNKNVIGHLSYY
ncbi:zinc finger BED domain-containing protein RICESLEEPER 2-like protein [Tanacetum coccineum]